MEAMMDLTEKTLSREEKYSGPLFSVHTDQVLLPNGQTSYREVVEHVDGVAVLALDERNNVLAVRQYRYVFGRTLLELPAGKLDPGEDPVTGALRELKEETGAVPDTFLPLGAFCPRRAVTARCCICSWPGTCTWGSSIWTPANSCTLSASPLMRWSTAAWTEKSRTPKRWPPCSRLRSS